MEGGEGWSGRGEEGESQGPLFHTPAPPPVPLHSPQAHTLVALPPPPSAWSLPPGSVKLGLGKEGEVEGE